MINNLIRGSMGRVPGTGTITEMDLIKESAIRITKQRMQQQIEKKLLTKGSQEFAIISKTIFANQLKVARQSWLAFSKAIKRAVENDKAIDTALIGLFVPTTLK